VLETLGKPVVAALNGTALGGGLEIALACASPYRPEQPEGRVRSAGSQLGLLPGGGGVTRIVRMLGIQNALMNVLMQGQRMKPAKAPSPPASSTKSPKPGRHAEAKARAWIKANPAAQQPGMPRATRCRAARRHSGTGMNLPAFPANLRKQLKGAQDYPAPKNIMCAAVEGAQVDFDSALKIEGRYFTSWPSASTAKNMIKAFFFDLQQKINKGGSRPSQEAFPECKTKKVGILGAGMMGQGIAYVSAAVRY
jgi:3-hydroxyacyl-CoA dehydrogenase/enoyl-CoA hydratase/3-hydroxybutyryl-CoA epimerase